MLSESVAMTVATITPVEAPETRHSMIMSSGTYVHVHAVLLHVHGMYICIMLLVYRA